MAKTEIREAGAVGALIVMTLGIVIYLSGIYGWLDLTMLSNIAWFSWAAGIASVCILIYGLYVEKSDVSGKAAPLTAGAYMYVIPVILNFVLWIASTSWSDLVGAETASIVGLALYIMTYGAIVLFIFYFYMKAK